MLKKTPLYAVHQKLGARMVEFGGWEMPVFYSSIIEEHKAVRAAAGIFDISHMGEISARGPKALEFVNYVLTNDARKLAPGQGQYTLMCNERAGTIDDLYLYRIDAEEYLMVVNAARISADFAWLERQQAALSCKTGVELKNRSEELASVAVQGPKSAGFIDNVFLPGAQTAAGLQKNEVVRLSFAGHTVFVSRTGYTGEDGFEIVAPAECIETIWNKLLEAGKSSGLKPAGLGARDTLRTEAGYPLYGHELDEDISPLEAGVGFFVNLSKGEFIGHAALAQQKAAGTSRKLVGFKMGARSAPPRPGYPIWSASEENAPMGRVTSGTQSPSLGIGIGLGFVAPEFSPANTAIGIEVRGKRFPATVVTRPIYKRS
ncbi:MAG TPA: glycine cleavage system aminomethyltransferase GcvT [Verrucomicrobiae bacterium]|jgi:aminomethyltransferase